MAQIIKFDVLSQRVGITINNGERRTPPPSKLNIGSLGTFVVISGEVNVPIDVVHDTVYLNSSTATQPNAMTASQMEAAIIALFPNSNSGSVGSGITDAVPTVSSTNPVQSGGVYAALQGKSPLISPQFSGSTYFNTSTKDNAAVVNIDAPDSNIVPLAITHEGKTYLHMVLDDGSGTYGMGLINGTYLALQNQQIPGPRDPQLLITNNPDVNQAVLEASNRTDASVSHSLVLKTSGDLFLQTNKANNVRIRTNTGGTVHECIYAYGSNGAVTIGANQNNGFQLEVVGTVKIGTTLKIGNNTAVDNVISDHPKALAMQMMGSNIVAQGMVCDDIARATSLFALVSQKSSWFSLPLYHAQTLAGIKCIIKTPGVYTPSNENRVGLFSTDGAGNLTLVASSTDNGTLWTAAAGMLPIPFSSAYTATAGLYYVCLLYSSSAETTAPSLAAAASTSLGAYAADFTNGNVLYGIKNSVTALPSTQALSGLTASAAAMWISAYK